MDDAAPAVAGAHPLLAQAGLGPLDAPQHHLQRLPTAHLFIRPNGWLLSQSVGQLVNPPQNDTFNGCVLPISASTLDPLFSESDSDWSLNFSILSQQVHGTLRIACKHGSQLVGDNEGI